MFCMQIKKFKDALAKYGTDLSCAGPARGLDESELMRLASMGEISLNLSSMSPSTNEVCLLNLLASRVSKGVFIGYPFGKKGYKIFDLDTRKTFISRDVYFVEHVFPFQFISDKNDRSALV